MNDEDGAAATAAKNNGGKIEQAASFADFVVLPSLLT